MANSFMNAQEYANTMLSVLKNQIQQKAFLEGDTFPLQGGPYHGTRVKPDAPEWLFAPGERQLHVYHRATPAELSREDVVVCKLSGMVVPPPAMTRVYEYAPVLLMYDISERSLLVALGVEHTARKTDVGNAAADRAMALAEVLRERKAEILNLWIAL